MSLRVGHIVQWLEELAPAAWAAEWDNVGLQVGSPAAAADPVMACLTVTPAVVKQATAAGVKLLVCHHPLIWRPLASLGDTAATSVLREALHAGIAVYASHTNLDAAPAGAGQWLGEALGLLDMAALVPVAGELLYKLAVYVPTTHLDQVREAICAAGAGHLGRYSHCTFAATGTGTFRPLAGSRPFLGQQGQEERVPEAKLETVVPDARLAPVLAAMKAAHPYEEIAYDCYVLAGPPRLGYGRVGILPSGLEFAAFREMLAEKLPVSSMRSAGPPPALVQRVAAVNGAGADYIEAAGGCSADVLVTGDMKYHQAETAWRTGLCVLDVGHFATEAMIPERLAAYMRNRADAAGWPVTVLVAEESDLLVPVAQ